MQSVNGLLGFQKHKPLRQEKAAPFVESYELALTNSFSLYAELLHWFDTGLKLDQTAQKVYLLPKESRSA